MGAWDHSYFGNDGAQDVLAQLPRQGGQGWNDVISGALENFGQFLARDARGETFRALTADELEQQDKAVKEALADLPHLIEEWDAGSADEDLPPTDVGDHEAQGAVAAAAVIALKLGADFVASPKTLRLPADFAPDADLIERAQRMLDVIAAHERLHEYVSAEWIKGVARLSAFLRDAKR